MQGRAGVAARPRLQAGDGSGGGAGQKGGCGRGPVGEVEEGGLSRGGGVEAIVD